MEIHWGNILNSLCPKQAIVKLLKQSGSRRMKNNNGSQMGINLYHDLRLQLVLVQLISEDACE